MSDGPNDGPGPAGGGDELAALRAENERLARGHARMRERANQNVRTRDEALATAAKAVEEKEAAEKRLAELQYHLRVPDGAVRADAWFHKGELIVCGEPADPPDDPDGEGPDAHNCDAMGCSSVSHVVIRERVTPWHKLESQAELARLRAENARLRLAADAVKATLGRHLADYNDAKNAAVLPTFDELEAMWYRLGNALEPRAAARSAAGGEGVRDE